MAYDQTRLAPIGGQSQRGNVGQLYHYDNRAGDTVTGANYFLDANSLLTIGDVIAVINYTAAVPSGYVTYGVTVVSTTAVTIAAI